MMDQWYLIFFNLMFSSFPQLVTGILDRDVSSETLLALPELYRNGQDSEVRCTHSRRSLLYSAFTWFTMLMNMLYHTWLFFYNAYLCCMLPF